MSIILLKGTDQDPNASTVIMKSLFVGYYAGILGSILAIVCGALYQRYDAEGDVIVRNWRPTGRTESNIPFEQFI